MSRYLTGNETRARLLDAAAEVFAEQGFRNAKVQDICQRAQANLASVNYHFGDKEQLYHEVVRYALDADGDFLPSLAGTPDAPAETRLRQFIEAFLSGMLSCEHPAWHGKLISHEMSEPTSALDLVVNHLVRPINDTLCGIVQELTGAAEGAQETSFFAACIISQCVIYHHSKEVVVRMNPDQRFDAQALQELTDRITRFSLAAIRHYADTQDETDQGVAVI